MTIQALKKKKQELLASQVSNLVSDTNENLLRVNLSKFFTDLEQDIQSALMEYWNDTILLQGQVNLILASIHEKHQEYYELIMKHKLQEFHRAEQQGKRLVKRQEQSAMKAAKPVKMTATRNNLFGTLKYSEDKLANDTFKASQNTLNRVDDNINQILTDGYKSGVGINEVSRQITERFDQLRTWEAKRIARTEIHTAQNMGVMNSYESLGVEYTQWIAAGDDRTRESHIEVDREIIPIGGTYSNGLAFPGDTSGPIEEWINCRCSNAPFVMPAGMMAPPGMSNFKESDLIPIETENPLEIQEPQPVEPIPQTPNSMVDGKYETYTEMDKRSKAETTVYKFENGLEIGINSKAQLTFEEVIEHIKSLPEPLRNLDTLNRINICGHHQKSVGGWFEPSAKRVEVFLSSGNKVDHFNTLNHELAHALDNKMGGSYVASYGLSKPEVYEPVFKEDNKLYTRVNERTGRKRTPKIFVTDYAARNFTKYKKQFNEHMKVWEKSNKTTPKPRDFRFGEDFADSTKKYLNPSTHTDFVKKFPNRANYLENIYGKPKFDKNSPISKAIEYERKTKMERESKQKRQEELNKKFEALSKNELDALLKDNFGKTGLEHYYDVKKEYDRLVAVRRTLFTEEPQFMIDVGYTPSQAIEYVENRNKYLKSVKKEYEKSKKEMDKLNNMIKQKL